MAAPASIGYRPRMRPGIGFAAFAAVLLGIRWGLAGAAGLSHDEAYYWQWSRQLAWGYYDHPPMVAYLILAGRALLGESELAVRFWNVLLGVAGLWLIASMARDRAAAWLSALAAAVVPLFAAAGTLATPDIPLVFFWTATVALCLRALETGRIAPWLAAGMTLGLGGLSKYTMVLLPPSLLAALVATPRGRAALRTPGPYLGAALALALCAPYFHWLQASGGGSVLNQLSHGLGVGASGKPSGNPLLSFGEFVGAQALLVTPILFVLAGIALWRAGAGLAGRGPLAEELRDPDRFAWTAMLFFPAALPAVVFAAASTLAYSHPNWPAVVYPTLFVLLGPELVRWSRGPRRRWIAAGLALPTLATVYLGLESVFPLVPYTSGGMVMVRDHGDWTGWAHELRSRRGESGLRAAVLAGDYTTASLLAFYLPDRPATDAPYERRSGSQYNVWRAQGRGAAAGKGEAWFFTTGRAKRADRRAGELLRDPEYLGAYAPLRRGVELEPVRAYFGEIRDDGRAR